MKRRFLLVTIVSIFMIFAFVSCSGNLAPEDKLGMISFGDDSRTVGYSVAYSDKVEEMYWYYTAVKADDGFTTGQTAVLKPVAVDTSDAPQQGLSGKTLNSVGFSYGYWTIELKGYKTTSCVGTDGKQVDGNDYKPKFTATLNDVLVQSQNTYATAKIEVGEGATTEIVFGDIYFESDNIQANSTFTLTVKDTKGTVTVDTSSSNVEQADGKITYKSLTYNLSQGSEIAGDHTMTFTLQQNLKKSGDSAASGTLIEVANYTLKFTVLKGTKTTISGDMTKYDQTGSIQIGSVQDLPVTNVSKALPVTSVTGNSDDNKTASVSETTTINLANVSITYPVNTTVNTSANKLSTDSTTSDTQVGLTYESNSLPGDGESGTITLSDANTSQKYNLTLDVPDTNTTYLTITIDVGTGQKFNKVYHNTTELDKLTTNSDSGLSKESYYYDETGSGNGKLYLYLNHASPIYLITKAPVATVNNVEKYTLKEAVEAVEENGTLTLLNNVTFSEDITVSKNFTLDLNNKVVTASDSKTIKVSDNKVLTIENSASGQQNIVDTSVKLGTINSANIDGTYYNTFDEAFSAAKADAVITLLKETEIKSAANSTYRVNKNLTLDLNKKTLKVENTDDTNSLFTIEGTTDTATFTIKNGKKDSNGDINGSLTCSAFCVKTNGNLVLDGISVSIDGSGASVGDYKGADAGKGLVLLYQGSNPVSATIKNSKLSFVGTYGIATNASKTEAGVSVVNVTIDNSEIETKNDNLETHSGKDLTTTLCINVPGTVVINKSTIKGTRQGAILRGASTTITDSTIENTGNGVADSYDDKSWGSGNEVPTAALVIGNRSGGYAYPTTVTFKTTGTNSNTVKATKSDRTDLYIYQADYLSTDAVTVDRSVNVTGTIPSGSGTSGALSINDNFNDAYVFYDTSWYDTDTSKSEYSISDAADLRGLAKLVNEGNTFSGKTIKLSGDIDLQGIAWTPIGLYHSIDDASDFDKKPFSGTFDGNSNTIKNLKITCDNGKSSYRALFGYVKDGTIQNLTIGTASSSDGESSSITACDSAAVVGALSGGTISGVTNNASVTVKTADSTNETYPQAKAAGIVVNIKDGNESKIENCTNNGAITTSGCPTATDAIGGIVAWSMTSKLTVSGCTNNGNVAAGAKQAAGGIIGLVTNASTSTKVSGCSNTGAITAGTDRGAGQLIGEIYSGAKGTITCKDCTSCTGSTSCTSCTTCKCVGKGSFGAPDAE